MITLHEEITVARSAKDCFRYVADFDRVYEWDATARDARKLSEGPIGLGTRFEVTCAVGPTTISIEYEIVDYQPWHSIELRGECKLFTVTDTIVFSDRDEKTHISYTAVFDYRWGLGRLEKYFLKGMQQMGRESLAGLQRALEDRALPPATLASSLSAGRVGSARGRHVYAVGLPPRQSILDAHQPFSRPATHCYHRGQ